MMGNVGSSQLPILVKPPYPMLARAGQESALVGAVRCGYQIEPKLDGIRCLAMIDEIAGRRMVRLFNRQLTDITARFPEVVESLKATVFGAGHTLDGELYVRGVGAEGAEGAEGEPDFQLVQTRANRTRDIEAAAARYPAVFGAFDMIRVERMNITHWALEDRRRALSQMAPQLVVPTYTQWEAESRAARRAGEGLMLKLLSSPYRAGVRDVSWLKVKWLREVECIVGGVTHGIGKRADTFGGLLMGVPLPEDREGKGRLKYIGTVGTGFTDARLRSLMVHLRMLRTTDCPFAERGTDWDLMHFVRPVMKARVAFAEYTRDGIMRFPRFLELV